MRWGSKVTVSYLLGFRAPKQVPPCGFGHLGVAEVYCVFEEGVVDGLSVVGEEVEQPARNATVVAVAVSVVLSMGDFLRRLPDGSALSLPSGCGTRRLDLDAQTEPAGIAFPRW